MEKLEKRVKFLEKEYLNLKDYTQQLEQKNETYWGILKSLVNSLREEMNNKISKNYFENFTLADIADLQVQIKKNSKTLIE